MISGKEPAGVDGRASSVVVLIAAESQVTAGRESTSLDGPVALVLAALVVAVVGRGGFFLVPRLAVGLLLAAAFVAAWRTRRLGPLRLLGIGLAGLAAWSVVSGLIAGHVAGALAPVGTLAGFGVTVAVVRGAGRIQRDQVVVVAIAVGALAALSGWVGVALRAGPWAHVDGGLWRAATTLTYANAAAAVLAALALLALGRLAGPIADHPAAWYQLAVTVLMVGLGATVSRAGIAGFTLGWVVLAALAGLRPVVRATLRPSAGALVAFAALSVSMPAVDPIRPLVALVGLAAGLVVGALPLPRRWVRGLGVAIVAVVAIGAGVVTWSSHRATVSSLWADRAGVSSPDRGHATHAAVVLARHHSIFGVGPGRTTLIWTTADHKLVVERYAHDEYLQLAVEQGLPALVLLSLIGVGLMELMGRGRPSLDRRGDAPGRTVWAGAVAGVVCIALHSGFDFLWHVPAVLLVAALLVGLATPVVAGAPARSNNNNQEAI